MKDILVTLKKEFKVIADTVPNWENMSKTELATAYCEAFDQKNYVLSDRYFSCLMYSYFYMIHTLYRTSLSLGLDEADFVDWVYEGLQMGLKYRGWLDPKMKVSTYKNGAEVVFNRCFFSVRQRKYENANRDKRSINYNTIPLTSILDEYGDIDESRVDDLDDIYDTPEYSRCDDVIKHCINKHNLINAIIVDSIAYRDVCKTGRVKNEARQETSNKNRLNNYISSLNDDYIKYFSSKYRVDTKDITSTIDKIKLLKPSKRLKLINTSLDSLRNDIEVRALLCY